MLTANLSSAAFRLVLSYNDKHIALDLPRTTSGTIISIVEFVLSQHGLALPSMDLAIHFDGRFLRPSDTLSAAIPDLQDRNEVILALIIDIPFVVSSMLRFDAGSDVFDAELDSSEFDLALGDVADDEECDDDVDALHEDHEEASPAKARKPAAGLAAVSHTIAAMEEAAPRARAKGKLVKRQATVRYYNQMNPMRTYPLLVAVSKKDLAKIQQAYVGQQAGDSFKVEKGTVVQIEPILPGCNCYPPKQDIRIDSETVTASFWIVPYVLGKVMGSRILVSQNATLLSEIPLNIRVVRKTLVVVMAILALLFPLIAGALKYYQLDIESQMTDGFGGYASIAQMVFSALSAELWAVVLLAATGLTYLWLRPRQCDMFWDISSNNPPASSFVERASRRLMLMAKTSARYGILCAIGGAVVGLGIVGVVAAAASVDQALSTAPLLTGLIVGGCAFLGFVAGGFEGMSCEGD